MAQPLLQAWPGSVELGIHFLPHQHQPRGPHVEGGLLHQAKAVMSRGKRKSWARKEGKAGRRGEADTQKAQDCSSQSRPGSEPAQRLFWGHGPPLSPFSPKASELTAVPGAEATTSPNPTLALLLGVLRRARSPSSTAALWPTARGAMAESQRGDAREDKP